MDYKETYEAWLANPYFDADTKKELESIAGDEDEIKERFYADLEFGTAGLRGIIGAGTNRMNIYTVRKATQGLANYIIKQNGQKKGVAIAYDSRRMSPEFADEAACCLAANGIKAYVFESLRPTPELSFAVRELGCISGINITASHNPPEYNGYKVYWEDGAQITPPHDAGIMDEVKAVTDYATVKTMDKDEAVKAGLYESIGQAVDDRYMEELKKNVLHPEAIKEASADLKIVYTPLHGTGNIPVRRVLKELGFTNVFVVPEQELLDLTRDRLCDFPQILRSVSRRFCKYLLNDPHMIEILRCEAHHACRILRFRAVLPQNTCESLWGEDGIDRVLQHPHLVCHSHGEGTPAPAFSDDDRQHRNLKTGHLVDISGDRFSLSPFFCLKPAESSRSIYEADHRTAKLLRLLHQTQRFAVSVRRRHAEVALDILLGILPLRLGDHSHRHSPESCNTADDRLVVGEIPVAVKFYEVRK